MNKVVMCTGYIGSGSSAVTNLLSEVKNYNNANGEYEFVLMHAPDGIFDLEDKLLTGNNALRSDEAIHRFLQYMNDLYSKKHYWVAGYNKIISPQFMEYVNDFVREIGTLELNDKWNYWYYTENPNRIMLLKKMWNKIIKTVSFNKIKKTTPSLYKEVYLAYPTEKEFYTAAKRFLEKIFIDMGLAESNLVLDQFVLPHNLFRVHNYFDGKEYVIVVKRDPRDVFLTNKYYWIPQNTPTNFPIDVEQFCIMYRKMKQLEKQYEYRNIIEIEFEDLIYKYDVTVKRIFEFLDINPADHVRKRTSFVPEISINNTQIFKTSEAYLKEAEYIYQHLQEFCYDFPDNIELNRVHSEIF